MRSKRLLNIFAALMLIVMMAASGSFAADDYTYNMKVSAGNNGKIDVGGGAKTKVTYEDVQRIADNIERGLSNTMEKEIQSTMIGRLIMEELKRIDQVAYVRFASVYQEFKSVDTFIDEINKLR